MPAGHRDAAFYHHQARVVLIIAYASQLVLQADMKELSSVS